MTRNTAFQRILLPLDGSELATIGVPYARALAGPGTKLVITRVVPDPTPMMELAGTSAYPAARIRARHVEEAREYIEAVAGTLRDAVPAISTEAVEGDPPEAIIDLADRLGADLIVMATHGRGFLGRVVIGSVADRVARAANVPVMLVHPAWGAGAAHVDDEPRIDRLVVPLDGSARARQALPVAERLARQLDVPVHLVRAVPTSEEVAHQLASHDDAYYAELSGAVADALASEAARLTREGVGATSEVIPGSAANVITDDLREGDVIVMTSHGMGGVRRWLLGSVAERLIRSGAAPVVLVPVAERRELAAGA